MEGRLIANALRQLDDGSVHATRGEAAPFVDRVDEHLRGTAVDAIAQPAQFPIEVRFGNQPIPRSLLAACAVAPSVSPRIKARLALAGRAHRPHSQLPSLV